MAVEQGALSPIDTTTNFINFYTGVGTLDFSEVNRIIHNGTQFVRMILQRPQAIFSQGGPTGSSANSVNRPQYIDGFFTEDPASNTNMITIGFGIPVITFQIKLYTTSFIDLTLSKWRVSTSLNNLDSEFNLTDFEAVIPDQASIQQFIVNGQFVYSIVVTAPLASSILTPGLPFWRITHTDSGAFNNLVEVEIIPPLSQSLSYFNSDGTFANSFIFEQINILDTCFDTTVSQTGAFYTIRFNNKSVGTTNLSLGDDFSAAAAGTASGTNNFNPARWSESNSNTAFLRISDELSYNVAISNGQLETTYALTSDFDVNIGVTPQTLTTEKMWLVIRALDIDNKVVASEGVGFSNGGVLPVTSGIFFSSYVSNFINSTANCNLKEARPLWHNTSSGVDSFTVSFSGSAWLVSGTQTGALSDATTGILYDENVDINTPLEFLISCTSTPIDGEKFTFDVTTDNAKKEPLSSGTLGLIRTLDVSSSTGAFQTTRNVLTTTGVSTIPTDNVNIELFGNTDSTVNISADNYTVNAAGSPSFPDIAVFTVEKVDANGVVLGTPLIESFDVIGDPSKNINDFLDGRVQIACSSSGSSGGGHIYLKVDNQLFKYFNNIALTSEDGSNAVVSTTAQINKDGTNSFAWTRESKVNGIPFLTYVEFDSILNIVQFKTINKDTLLDTTPTKEVLLNIANYLTSPLKVFYNQNDFDTLYFIDLTTSLQTFNLDDRISAFLSVNAEDVTLPAGTSQQTFVNADVINAWGQVLSGKNVTFSVTGDGAVTPSTDATDSSGRATTQFTVGSTVGISVVTATVTEN